MNSKFMTEIYWGSSHSRRVARSSVGQRTECDGVRGVCSSITQREAADSGGTKGCEVRMHSNELRGRVTRWRVNHERYFERRRRNNLAAKKSRDQRKFREEAVAQRAEALERENAMLRTQVGWLLPHLYSIFQDFCYYFWCLYYIIS